MRLLYKTNPPGQGIVWQLGGPSTPLDGMVLNRPALGTAAEFQQPTLIPGTTRGSVRLAQSNVLRSDFFVDTRWYRNIGTAGLWFMPTDLTINRYVFGCRTEWAVGIKTDGALRFVVRTGAGVWQAIETDPGIIQANVAYQVVVRLNRVTQDLFLNGLLVASVPFTGKPEIDGSGTFDIGADFPVSGMGFSNSYVGYAQGAFCFPDVFLTGEEIFTLYRAGLRTGLTEPVSLHLVSSGFQSDSPQIGVTHFGSQWQIAEDRDFKIILADTLMSASLLTEWITPPVYDRRRGIYARVRYMDNYGGVSLWDTASLSLGGNLFSLVPVKIKSPVKAEIIEQEELALLPEIRLGILKGVPDAITAATELEDRLNRVIRRVNYLTDKEESGEG